MISETNKNDSIIEKLCYNYWPSEKNQEFVKGMPNSKCKYCANWLPDIEDIASMKTSGCGNKWPKNKENSEKSLEKTLEKTLEKSLEKSFI